MEIGILLIVISIIFTISPFMTFYKSVTHVHVFTDLTYRKFRLIIFLSNIIFLITIIACVIIDVVTESDGKMNIISLIMIGLQLMVYLIIVILINIIAIKSFHTLLENSIKDTLVNYPDISDKKELIYKVISNFTEISQKEAEKGLEKLLKK